MGNPRRFISAVARFVLACSCETVPGADTPYPAMVVRLHDQAGVASLTVSPFNCETKPGLGDSEPPTFVLHVDDRARMPGAVQERARAETLRVYQAAGVRAIWVDGANDALAGGD